MYKVWLTVLFTACMKYKYWATFGNFRTTYHHYQQFLQCHKMLKLCLQLCPSSEILKQKLKKQIVMIGRCLICSSSCIRPKEKVTFDSALQIQETDFDSVL